MSIIVPEIYAGLITEKVKGKLRIASQAETLGELSGTEGDTIQFPKWKALSDAVLMAKGDKINTEELNQTTSSKKIKQFGKGVQVFDITSVTGMGKFIENANSQQATVFARCIDNEMVADIDANVILKKSSAGAKVITEGELNDAINLFGDEQDSESFSSITINSLLVPSFLAMTGFVDSTKTFNGLNSNGIVQNGQIGLFRGIPVILADNGTYDSTKAECKSYIIKKGALGYIPKRDLNVEEQRDGSTKSTNIYADIIFAAGIVQADGVAVIRKTIV